MRRPARPRAQGDPRRGRRGPRAFPAALEDRNEFLEFRRGQRGAVGSEEIGGKQKRAWGRIGAAAAASGWGPRRGRVGAAPVGPGSCARPALRAGRAAPGLPRLGSGWPRPRPGAAPPHLRAGHLRGSSWSPGCPGQPLASRPPRKPRLRLGIWKRTTTSHTAKTAPTRSRLAHFPLCLIMMTSRILFLGELYPPPNKTFLSPILRHLLGK